MTGSRAEGLPPHAPDQVADGEAACTNGGELATVVATGSSGPSWGG